MCGEAMRNMADADARPSSIAAAAGAMTARKRKHMRAKATGRTHLQWWRRRKKLNGDPQPVQLRVAESGIQ